MTFTKSDFIIKKSTIPNAGKGLFTKKQIAKGTEILEYTGKVTSWEDADHQNGQNLYIFYVNKNHVVDASVKGNNLARYANDADGLTKVKGLKNNSVYEIRKKRIMLIATKTIPEGGEILVEYGKDYWKTIKDHIKEGVL
ncbi:MAG: SET domain-containing protein-lysine N-methyltransferase [Bacteroidetes bacterium]|nr:SET domain-containing protein-lysine N-methyltransferase [Bacteroidota bacterium]